MKSMEIEPDLSLEEWLEISCYSGDLDKAEECLKKGVDKTMINKCLERQAHKFNHDVIKLLLKYGADTSRFTCHKFSLSQLWVWYIDKNAPELDTKTFFEYFDVIVCRDRSLPTLKLLFASFDLMIHHLKDMECYDNEIFPFIDGDYNKCKEIIDNVGKCGIQIETAVYYGHYDIVKMWLGENNVHDFRVREMSLLVLACIKGHYRIFKFLLERGASTDGITRDMPLIDFVVVFNRHDMLKLLTPDNLSDSCLQLAIIHSDMEMVKLLVDMGANPAHIEKVFTTNNYIDKLRIILERGHYDKLARQTFISKKVYNAIEEYAPLKSI